MISTAILALPLTSDRCLRAAPAPRLQSGHSSRDLYMVVHVDDFIVAGCGDDLDWLSQKLNEKLELVQRANRCVIYNESGLTWEADPRHAKLAVAELGLQSARPQTSPGGAKHTT